MTSRRNTIFADACERYVTAFLQATYQCLVYNNNNNNNNNNPMIKSSDLSGLLFVILVFSLLDLHYTGLPRATT